MKITVIAIILSLLAINTIHSDDTEAFDCQMSKMDQSLSQLTGFFGVKEMPWRRNIKEIRQYCRQLSKASSQAADMANSCLGGLSSTIISVTALKATKLNRSIYCKSRQIMQKAVDHGKCGNVAKNETMKCWVKMIDIMVNLKNASSTNKIPGICCAFYEWRDCTVDAFKNIGQNICSEDDIKFFADAIDKGSLDPLNILCSDYDESDQCDKVSAVFDRTHTNSSFQTFFPALVDVFESI